MDSIELSQPEDVITQIMHANHLPRWDMEMDSL